MGCWILDWIDTRDDEKVKRLFAELCRFCGEMEKAENVECRHGTQKLSTQKTPIFMIHIEKEERKENE